MTSSDWSFGNITLEVRHKLGGGDTINGTLVLDTWQQSIATHVCSFSWCCQVIWQITDNAQALMAYPRPASPLHLPFSHFQRLKVCLHETWNEHGKRNCHKPLSHGRKKASKEESFAVSLWLVTVVQLWWCGRSSFGPLETCSRLSTASSSSCHLEKSLSLSRPPILHLQRERMRLADC